ncbi:C40 family peptidase [Microlunatus antarcticus]|uniref:Cell wall-associated NlpC family hydrolase n=1 Tax=Microlunatus antarcticus TaxID=53388 RepID=A0A7W5JUH6_9ACTN|nr:NlpC/P60 family protein [Microlunatus antarcticus]MBB3326478.1 cell wall-associated NlpC family hydrolase [Microlunatus antarcticus]
MTRLLALLAVLAALLLGLPVAAALALSAASNFPPASSTDGTAGIGRSADVSASGAATRVLRWADSHAGDRYRMGANGPHAWDCSSFTQAAWAKAGVRLPRIAQDQRDWLADGHGTRIPPGHEQAGDLIFWDSYLGPRTIGHVVLVHDPQRRTTIEAHNTRLGVGHFTYQPRHHRYEIWRPDLAATATT